MYADSFQMRIACSCKRHFEFFSEFFSLCSVVTLLYCYLYFAIFFIFTLVFHLRFVILHDLLGAAIQ